MKSFNKLVSVLFGFLLLTGSISVADVKLPAIIGDNMVLQQHAKIPIWGTADAGEKVTVALRGQKLSTTADSAGKWQVRLNPLDIGEPFEITIAGKNTIRLQNVLVGEVWVCSGQSNMQWSVKASANPDAEIASAEYPNIRLFSVKRTVAEKPLSDVEGEWVACRPETVADFSAVGYFFGRELHKMLNVPVGLIHTSWGGTPAESWTSHPKLARGADFKPILDRWTKILAEYPLAKANYDQQSAQWEKDAEKAKSEGQEPPRRPRAPLGPNHPHRPAGLYNGMIAPLIPYAIQGAIWYQGESNAGRAYQYRKLFPTMIQDWRQAWGQGDFPFLFVQLANWREIKTDPVESSWAELREAQSMTLSLPKTAMAVAIDIGEADDIHPKNKQEVGRRLALAARAIYGQEVVYSGPIYASMKIANAKIRLHFTHTGGGLMAKGGETLKGFSIAGKDHKFVWAQAKIDGDTVVVWSDAVPNPVAVRYAWADNPVCNLYNNDGLPASPFRTDKLPGVTADKQ